MSCCDAGTKNKRTDASSLARKGVCKERLYSKSSLSPLRSRFRAEFIDIDKLSLRDRQAARGREGEAGELRTVTGVGW